MPKKGFKHSEHTKEKIRKSRIGKKMNKANNWKGGIINVGGYIYIKVKDHPNKTKDGYVAEHRLVVEKSIGRYLKKHEIVHHVNENKQDNRIENLRLLADIKIHNLKHKKKREKNGRFIKN